MKITDVYEQYRLIPGLRLHQLRVAAVAWQICDLLNVKVDTDVLMRACLLHDMGNIIKSDLTIFPEFVEELGIEYWQNVKAEFIDKYGHDEHHATFEITKELGMSENVISTIKAIGFNNAIENETRGETQCKICPYADMRVGPFGVLSLDQRLAEGEKRYRGNRKWVYTRKKYEIAVESLHRMEKQIFGLSDLKPGDITDQSIIPYLEKLKNYEI